jgi:hypothetical protein
MLWNRLAALVVLVVLSQSGCASLPEERLTAIQCTANGSIREGELCYRSRSLRPDTWSSQTLQQMRWEMDQRQPGLRTGGVTGFR